MDSITIVRNVVVKQIVTENFKKKAGAELQEALKKTETDLETFEKQAKKTITELTLKGHPQVDEFKSQFEAEKHKIVTLKQQLLEKLKVISKINIGEEIVQGTIDSQVEIKVGDNFEKLNRQEIVIKDGIIIEIR